MSKILVGCFVVLLLIAVGGATAGYFFLYKPATQFVGDVQRFTAEFQEQNERLQARGSYNPPGDGRMSEAQFQRLLAAQQEMRGVLQHRLTELQHKYDALKHDLDEDGREPSLRELAGAYRDMGDVLLTAKRAQVEALNRAGFSLQEYAWVRDQSYRALGQQAAVVSLGDTGPGQPVGAVPQDVVDMVSPHREELMEVYVLAWFGI